MQKPAFLLTIRFILMAGVLFGVLLVVISFLSYENIASALHGLAADGRFESFTPARYQAFSTFSIAAGGCMLLFAGTLLIWWSRTQEIAVRLLVRIGDSNRSLWQDARTLGRDLWPADITRTDLWLMFGVLLIAGVMRLASLFIPMDFDEAYTYNAFASQSLWHTISDYHVPNNHVLLTVFINVLVHLFGNNLWLMRLPTLIAGLLMVPAGYLLARRLYGREAAIVSAVLISVFPVLVRYSVLARGYIIMSLLTLAIFLLADYVRENKNRFAWLMLIVFSALGFFTIPIMLFPFGIVYVWLFLACFLNDIPSYRSRLDFLKYWLTGGVATLFLTAFFYLPILLNKSNRLFTNKFIAPVGWDVYPREIAGRFQDTWINWTSLLPGWSIWLGVFGLLLGLVLHRRIASQKVPMQIATFIWLAGFIIIRRPDMETRMWTFLAAPLLIWSAGGLTGALQALYNFLGRGPNLARIFSSMILISAIIFGIFTLSTIPTRWQPKGSVENATLFLKDRLQEGDLVSTSTAFKPLLQYYFGVYDIPLKYLRQSGNFTRVFVVVRSVGWSASAGDTLEVVAPRNEMNLPAIDLATAKILLQYEDLAIYESYPHP
jgi:4-amino-4-deoxy-L-arabinose transferase-like glycosyltransferase